MSADNQQERLIKIGWIIGFVDGEGCFSVSVFKNSTAKLGWQVFPEFAVTQGAKSVDVLKLIQKYFQCGSIVINRRSDNHRENLYRFLVRNIHDLNDKIVPFFQKNKLKTSKKNDFNTFAKIIDMILNKKHLTYEGLTRIAELSSTMNRKSQSKFLLESSETTR